MGAPLRLGVAGAALFFFSAVFGFWGFEKFLYYKIGQNVALKKGSEMRKAWSKFPIAVEFRIYIFNVTNPDEISKGAKPIVNEIGPFFFDEWKEKVRFEDDPHEDTVSFNQRTTWVFKPERSNGLTMEETIYLPHPMLLGMVMMTEMEKPAALGMINKAIPALFNEPTSIFLKVKVRDLLFDGVPLNCSSNDFGAKAICTMIRQNPKGLKQLNKDIFLFSFFGMKNGTIDDGRFTVKRGINNPKEVGQMVRFNGEPKLKVWASGGHCNDLKGTDSTIFPPFLTPHDDIVSFAPDLCRSLGAKFQYHLNYKGIPGNHYTATLGDQSANPDEKCFCPKPDKCMKRGAFDITKCAGAPIVLTLPHFYETDPSYLDTVTGLNPTKENHQIFLNFEPITGTPLGARKRLQFNIEIHAVKKITIMKELPYALMPLLWVEEGLELEQDFIDMLDAQLFRTLRIVGVGKWILMLAGLGLMGGGAFLNYHRSKKGELSPAPKEKSGSIHTVQVGPMNNDASRY